MDEVWPRRRLNAPRCIRVKARFIFYNIITQGMIHIPRDELGPSGAAMRTIRNSVGTIRLHGLQHVAGRICQCDGKLRQCRKRPRRWQTTSLMFVKNRDVLYAKSANLYMLRHLQCKILSQVQFPIIG